MSHHPVFEIKDLQVGFAHPADSSQTVIAVNGVSLHISKGETVALVGESGSGKSVSATAALDLLPGVTRIMSGEITLNGEKMVSTDKDGNVTHCSTSLLRSIRGNHMSIIFQQPLSSFNQTQTVGQQVDEALLIHQPELSRAERKAEVIRLFDKVQLPDPENRFDMYPGELSGGQLQRVMIAMAMANKPDLLIADEPTTALDVTVQAEILKLMKELQEETGMAILFITHDLGVVKRISDRVYVMQAQFSDGKPTGGEIVEEGDTQSVFKNPQHPYTKKLLNAVPKGTAKPLAPGAEVLLEAEDIKVHFPIRKGVLRRKVGQVEAVNGISLTLHRGETIAIVGESGSGKSTLGNALLRLFKDGKDAELGGKVVLQGTDITPLFGKKMRPYRTKFQKVFQDPDAALSPRMSVLDIIMEGLIVHSEGSKADMEAQVKKVLARVGMPSEVSDRYPHEFSGGQKQRIAIARTMVLEPDVVVLDEPTSALDMTIQGQVIELLREIQEREGLGYLFITHDLKLVKALCHKVIVMKDGLVVEQGTVKDVFNSPQHNYTKALLGAAFDNVTQAS
jgi:microcin C transport system ATP-binding protein